MQMHAKTEWMKMADEGDRIAAIKDVRNRYELSLMQAKRIVDDYADAGEKLKAINDALKAVNRLTDEQRRVVFDAFGVGYQAAA